MKTKCLAVAWVLAAACMNVCAQNLKFGKPADEELNMTVYEKDPDASAVVLCQLTTVDYNIDYYNYFVDYRIKKRIKILKEEGKDYGNVSFSYIFNEKEKNCQEYIEDFSATAYNVENGTVVKTKIGKEQLHTERLNEDYMIGKFAVPQVKAGTVVEYEFRIHSNVFYHIYDWVAQEDIPVAFAKYVLSIPTLFMFNVEVNGIQPLENDVTTGSIKFKATTNNLSEEGTCKTNVYTCIGRDMVALKKDDFVWHMGDYLTRVTAELKGIYSPDLTYHEIRKTWEQIDNQLLEHPDFGGRLGGHSKFRNELMASGIGGMADLKEKVSAIFVMLKDKLAWNGDYELLARSASETIKKGSGSNADLNMILINMLGDVGVKAYPVVMSTRSHGHLPASYPSLNKLSTFIVGIPDGDSWLYLDASAIDGYLNTLPANLYTDQARIIRKGKPGQWVNLQEIGDAKTVIDVKATLSADGLLEGVETVAFSGNAAASERRAFRTSADSTAFVSKKAKDNGVEITECQMTGHRSFSPTVREVIHFTKQGEKTPEYIYINPFPEVPVSKSPFLETERILPVEFPFKQLLNMSVSLTLPEGWELEEIPKRTKIAAADNSMMGTILYDVKEGNVVSIQYRFRLKDIIYPSDKYDTLKQLFDLLASRSKDILVLKKK